MTEAERAALRAELETARRKLAKRRDMPGMASNVESIEARVAEIEAMLAAS